MKKSEKKDSLGLSKLGNLSSMLESSEVSTGLPMNLSVDLIDEDPDQPRTIFNEDTLLELSASIKVSGVKTPISVKKVNDRFVINHGARRLRASILAGLDTIPGFIDNDYSTFDQIAENLQRSDLTAREIANIIGKLESQGHKRVAIAKQLGKSNAFVTQHASLLDLPGQISDAFYTGKVKDLTTVNELVNLHKEHPTEVDSFIEKNDEIIRRMVKDFKSELKGEKTPDVVSIDDTEDTSEDENDNDNSGITSVNKANEVNTNVIKKPIIQVQHKGQIATLLVKDRASSPENANIQLADGEILEVELSDLILFAIIDGAHS